MRTILDIIREFYKKKLDKVVQTYKQTERLNELITNITLVASSDPHNEKGAIFSIIYGTNHEIARKRVNDTKALMNQFYLEFIISALIYTTDTYLEHVLQFKKAPLTAEASVKQTERQLIILEL